MQIVPAILETNEKDFLNQIDRLSTYFNHFQIDIADGRFVPNKTLQIEDLVKLSTLSFKRLMFNVERLTFDFHLMVEDYEAEIEKLTQLKKNINIKTVFIHYSLFPKYEILNTKYYPITIGLVLNPQDQVEDLVRQYNLNDIQAIQIMSINPGFQGRPFIPETLNKIEQLRKLGYRNQVLLDGGVSDKTLSIILSRKFKPDILCVGSFFTKAGDLKKNIQLLRKNISV